MSLMNHNIRPKPQEDDNMEKSYNKKWSEYNLMFSTQMKLMEEEIGCSFDIQGHVLLLKAVSLPEKTRSGLLIPDDVRKSLITKYNIGLVIGMGPESYRDKERFPGGPRCKVGDWISFQRFEKIDEVFNDYRCYIIEDDRVNWPIKDINTVVVELRNYS